MPVSFGISYKSPMQKVICLATVTSIICISTLAYADDLFTKSNLASAYKTHPMISKALQTGMTSDIFRTIDKPATTMAHRAALIDAVVQSRKSPKMAEQYTRYLTRQRKKTINQLTTPEAFALGWMRARQNPTNFARRTGKNEIERADPISLIGAAANRMRGEMTINMVFALVKAQAALNQPKNMLCQPSQCLDDALTYHRQQWSLSKDAVCQMVLAVTTLDKAPKLGTKLCKNPPKPIAQYQPKQKKFKRFSHQLQPQQQSPYAMLRAQQIDPRVIILLTQMHKQAMQQMNGHGITIQKASPKTIELQPPKPTQSNIIIDTGNHYPTQNEIILEQD